MRALTLDPQIGNYIAAMLADPDQSKSRNRTVRIFVESWKTGDEIKLFEEVTGRKVEIEPYPLGDGVSECLSSFFPFFPFQFPVSNQFVNVVETTEDRSAYPQYPRLIAHNHYWIDPALNDISKWPQIKPKGMKAWLAEKVAKDALPKFKGIRASGARPEAVATETKAKM